MNILLTNDDGILAEGITALAKSLSTIVKVYIVAPKDQKSASGHGISIGKKMAVEELDLPYSARAFAVDGTPADCVRLGLYILEKSGITIHKVVSGANHGINLGTDTLYSGTVSAAVEGAMNRKPSIAVSIGSRTPVDFDAAGRAAIMTVNLPPDIHRASIALSINLPNRSWDEIKGIKVTRLGVMEYEEIYTSGEPTGSVREYVYAGKAVFGGSLLPGTDIEAYKAGYITITPLHFDLTDHIMLNMLSEYYFEREIEQKERDK